LLVGYPQPVKGEKELEKEKEGGVGGVKENVEVWFAFELLEGRSTSDLSFYSATSQTNNSTT